MTNPIVAIPLGMLAALIALFYVTTDGFRGWASLELGELSIPEHRFDEIEALVNRTDEATTDNYDSLDQPRGTTFTVPTGMELVIVKACAVDTTDGVGTHLSIGYGDSAVADSATPPTNAVTVSSTVCSNEEGQSIQVVIPEGKIPFAQSHSKGTNTWEASAFGYLKAAD